MTRPCWLLTIAAIASACGGHHAANPDASAPADASVVDAPLPACSDYNSSNNLYWGDLHTHTALSADAYEWGNRNFPHDAYRFASDPTATTQISAAGKPNPGPVVSIARALDFDAVTDHSEWLGATWGCGEFANGSAFNPSSPYLTTSQCMAYRAEENGVLATFIADAEAVVKLECNGAGEGSSSCSAFTASAFQVERQAAHDAYQRCTFTPLVAYEYTRAANGATLHQNVIFGSENVPSVPFDSTEYPQPADLWNALDQNCTSAMGCSVLTIPHNSNLSQGSAFVIPAGVDAMKQMNQYQRLVEIHQHKGDSECYAGSAAPDPTCNFEHVTALTTPTPELPANFVRHALGDGITAYAQNAVNPLQMGIVGATDDHNGLPGYVTQDTWQGHLGDTDYTPAQRLSGAAAERNPGAITGVWASQNTREDIFAALQRRETYATSGPRIAVRFYEVWNTTDYCGAQGGGFPANIIAAGGVPMGGTMAAAPSGVTAPQFVVNALKDANDLAEVDIIKGMYVNGALTEVVQRFYPSTAGTTWTNGSACISWMDPAFNASGPAFYYVRVLEVPTWRWSHYDCLADPTAAGCGSGSGSNTLNVMVQQRAWTSPIWWLP